jgi:hypothetical protein
LIRKQITLNIAVETQNEFIVRFKKLFGWSLRYFNMVTFCYHSNRKIIFVEGFPLKQCKDKINLN